MLNPEKLRYCGEEGVLVVYSAFTGNSGCLVRGSGLECKQDGITDG